MFKFSFIWHSANAYLFIVSIDAPNLPEAFRDFAHNYWNDDIESAIGVWEGNALVARIVPRFNPDTGRHEPELQMFPEASKANRFACGD